jgi:phenylacetate-CoA ligase
MSDKLEQLIIRVKNDPILQPICHNIYKIFPNITRFSTSYKNTIKLLNEIEKNPEKIDSIQRKLLTKLLKHAIINVPYYQKRVKIDPSGINTSNVFEKLEEFPLITKDEVMKYFQDFISIKTDLKGIQYETSGGSTGTGIRVCRNWKEIQSFQAFIDFYFKKYGYNEWSKMAYIKRSGAVGEDENPFIRDGRELFISPHYFNDRWIPNMVKKIQEFKPDFIRGLPSCIEIIAGYLKEKGLSLKCKAVSVAYEAVLPAQIELFKEIFSAPVIVEYGACEHVLFGHGCYNGEDIHYHFNPLYGVVENYWDKNGNYELVGTGLWNYVMPLIRYRTYDYGKISELKDNCAICGKNWKTTFHLDGRKHEFLVTKQNTLYAGHSVTIDKFIWDYVRIFQFIQNKPGYIELYIVPRGNLSKKIENKILNAQKKRLSKWFDVSLVKVDDIIRTKGGKRGLVIVNNGNGR